MTNRSLGVINKLKQATNCAKTTPVVQKFRGEFPFRNMFTDYRSQFPSYFKLLA